MRNKLLAFMFAAMMVVGALAAPAHAGWTQAGLQGENILALTEDLGETTIWYAGTAMGNVYSYDDATAAWTQISTGLPGQSVLSIEIASLDPAVVYAGTDGGGVYSFDTASQTWSSAGLDTLSVRAVKVDPYISNIVFAVTPDAVYGSSDGGLNWGTSLVAADLRDFTFSTPDYTLDPQPGFTSIMYAASASALYKSTDGGGTWAALDTGISNAVFSRIVVDPLNPSTLYAGTQNMGIMKSTDSGATWSLITNGMGDQDISSIAFYALNTTSLLAGTADGKIYRTDNGGDSWYLWHTLDSGGTTVNSIGFLIPQSTYILAATDNGIIMFDNSLPDLLITSFTGADTLGTGFTNTVSLKVLNQGGGLSKPNDIAVYLSTDTVLGGDDTILNHIQVNTEDSVGYLYPGDDQVVTVDITIPLNWKGANYLIAMVDGYQVKVVESDETNNEASKTINVLAPDLTITSFTGADTLGTGFTNTVSLKVLNQGGGLSKPNDIAVYLSTDTVLGGDDTILNHIQVNTEDSVGYLYPGDDQVVTVDITIPLNWKGANYLIAMVDGYQVKVVESDETNNEASKTINVLAPDLTITSFTGADTLGTGFTNTVSLKVLNQGGGLSKPNDIAVYLSTDTVLGGDDTILNHIQVNTEDSVGYLYPGDDQVVTVDITIPLNWKGANYLIAMVDGYQVKVVESDETNNEASKTINVLAPDLVITSFTGADTLGTGFTNTVSLKVLNQGGGLSKPNDIAVYLSTDTVLGGDDTILNHIQVNTEDSVGYLYPGDDQVVTVDITIPLNWDGTGYLIAMVDGYQVKVVESDETNNTFSIPLYNINPIASAGVDQAHECTSFAGAQAILNGSGSTDANYDTLTYTWTGVFGTATGVSPTVQLPLGANTITLTVDDGRGGSSTDTVIVTISDTTAPAITITGITDGATYTFGQVPQAGYTVIDACSLVTYSVTLDSVDNIVFTYSVNATDTLLNSAQASASYTVIQ